MISLTFTFTFIFTFIIIFFIIFFGSTGDAGGSRVTGALAGVSSSVYIERETDHPP